MSNWIGVDLDRTLAEYNSGDWSKYGPTYIGAPIPKMIERVKNWLSQGIEVRVFTARIANLWDDELEEITKAIHEWCVLHIGHELEITNQKDYEMIEYWDDLAIQVEQNTGNDMRDVKYNEGYTNGYEAGFAEGYYRGSADSEE